jgi:hypothetical protein
MPTSNSDSNADFEFLHQPTVGHVIGKNTKATLTDHDCNPEFICVIFDPSRDQAYLDKYLHIGKHVDMQDNWDYEALAKFNLQVNENNNTTIIVDNTFAFITSFSTISKLSLSSLDATASLGS